jgi:hypothetical protein
MNVQMQTLIFVILIIIVVAIVVRSSYLKRKTMRHGEITPAWVFKKKYNLTAENRTVIKINPLNIPSNLRELILLAEKWGIEDDIIRDDFEEKATDAEKEELRAQLKGRTKEITDWLDSFSDGREMTTDAGHFMFMLEALDEMQLWPD